MILGLSGKKRSGKSTVASFLCSEFGFKEISWAYPLKEIIGNKLLGLTHDQMYGEEEIKEAVDPFWGKSPRDLLQIIGTDCFRKQVHPEFWVKLGIREIEKQLKSYRNIVVSDCRFPNEMRAIEKLGGHPVRITREGQINNDSHPSEIALDTYSFPYEIVAKSGDIEGLELRSKQLVTTIDRLESGAYV